jgi:hypothetical protein
MAKQNAFNAGDTDLFAGGETPLPRAYEGELLYSWCARFHRLSGNAKARTTSLMLFDHPTVGLLPDFPNRIENFQQATRHWLGATSDVIEQRTQFALHAPFLDLNTRQAVVAAMSGQSTNTVHQSLGINRSALAIATRLKACPDCINEDRSTAPASWWRMDHQWPTSYFCLRHSRRLRIMVDRSSARGLLDWYLPGELQDDAWASQPTLDSVQADRLLNAARWTEVLLHRQNDISDPTLLRHVYLLQAKSRDWLAWDGTLRFASLRNAFADAHRGLENLHGLGFLTGAQTVNGGFLGMLLREHPGRRHPLKHVLLMAFLFEDSQEFFERYEAAQVLAMTEGFEALHKQLTATRTRLVEMVSGEGRSVNAACLQLGIPPVQAIKRLRKEGVAYRVRPRVLNPTLKSALDELLQSGADRNDIAKQLKVRKAFIKDYLAVRPELRDEWSRAFAAQQTARYRKHFLEVLQENPTVPIKRIRRISGNGFEWLYRNDRDWLAKNLPGIWRR